MTGLTLLTLILGAVLGILTAIAWHQARIYRQDRDYEHGLYRAAAARAGLTRDQAEAQAARHAQALHPRLCRILRYR